MQQNSEGQKQKKNHLQRVDSSCTERKLCADTFNTVFYQNLPGSTYVSVTLGEDARNKQSTDENQCPHGDYSLINTCHYCQQLTHCSKCLHVLSRVTLTTITGGGAYSHPYLRWENWSTRSNGEIYYRVHTKIWDNIKNGLFSWRSHLFSKGTAGLSQIRTMFSMFNLDAYTVLYTVGVLHFKLLQVYKEAHAMKTYTVWSIKTIKVLSAQNPST